jgi:putative solute:sodium symporter small subunit
MVALIVVCAFVLPMFAAELNTDSLLSFPLGYYFAAQGVMIVLIVAVYWAGSRQAETDRKFGAMDDL